MGAINLKNNIYWVGVNNPELKVFDIIMETKKGTTYNSYLINDDKVAIIDSVKNGFFSEFLSNIKEVIGDKKVDYIIVQHTELDHSGSLKDLIKMYPEAEVIGSKAALMYTKNIINSDFNGKVAGEDLKLGNTTLKFISAPNLHWPDTMFTYAQEDKVLFTCDFLGCHYCPEKSITDNCAGDYFEEMKYYFDCIMGPYKKYVQMGLEKIKDLELEIVAPSHGPVHKEDISKYTELYAKWSVIEKSNEKNIQIFYITAYGNTEKMANYIKDKIIAKGIKAEAHEITSMKIEEVISLIENSTGVLMGSPTINQDAVKPVWDVLSMVCAITSRGKIAGAFGSYGWSGEGVQMMTDRLKSLKFKVVEPGLRFTFVPSEEDFKNADDFVEKYLSL